MILRPYQQDVVTQVAASTTHDLVQLDTGAGKTPVLAALAAQSPYFIAIAHRNILIAQLSEKLAAFGIVHNIIATEHTRRRCLLSHRQHGLAFIDRSITTRWVASIDSLLARHRRGALALDTTAPYLILIDEAHHAIETNKWGKLRELFPNARFVGFTATPCRADGRSLHLDEGGLFDRLVQPQELKKDSVKTLIGKGFLSDFKVYSVASDIDHAALRMGGGDYTTLSLQQAIRNGAIIGDAVRHYKRLAIGRQAVAMCVSIRNADETAERFRDAGIPAACISSQMSASEVAHRLDRFLAREINVLCNVDMVGEGFDVPGIEAIIMLRKTASFVSYRQWIGRSLRPLPGKGHAIIIDHVGNVVTHDLPDKHIDWDLRRPPAGTARSNLIDCPECSFVYRAWLAACPECGAENDLKHRRHIGGHYVNQDVIDFELCEVKRHRAKQAQQLETEIIWPPMDYGNNAIGALCKRLREWFIEALKPELTIRQINEFLHSASAQAPDFWIEHFTLHDLKANNPAKALRVYKKWQKSRL